MSLCHPQTKLSLLCVFVHSTRSKFTRSLSNAKPMPGARETPVCPQKLTERGATCTKQHWPIVSAQLCSQGSIHSHEPQRLGGKPELSPAVTLPPTPTPPPPHPQSIVSPSQVLSFLLLAQSFEFPKGRPTSVSQLGLLEQECHRLGGFNIKYLFLTVPEAENSRSRRQQTGDLVRPASWF